MITASDFVHLPFTPDLTEGGITYACRSLNYTYNRMGGSSYARLRRIVGGVAVELAFRHYLTSQSVPFDVEGAMPFNVTRTKNLGVLVKELRSLQELLEQVKNWHH